VEYRIGNNDVQSETWQLSTDNTTVFYSGNVMNFLNALETSTVFVAQVTPVGMDAINATYDTAGLSAAALPVLRACGFDQTPS
jgi:type VI secretion system protein VasI